MKARKPKPPKASPPQDRALSPPSDTALAKVRPSPMFQAVSCGRLGTVRPTPKRRTFGE
jgi:hypothetical protein